MAFSHLSFWSPTDCGDLGRIAGHTAKNSKATHIDGHMAHDTGMVRKPDVLVLVVHPVGFDGTARSWFIVDDECARDVDLDGAGVADRLLHPRHARGALAADISLRRSVGGGSHDAEQRMSCQVLKRALGDKMPVPRLTAYISFYPAATGSGSTSTKSLPRTATSEVKRK